MRIITLTLFILLSPVACIKAEETFTISTSSLAYNIANKAVLAAVNTCTAKGYKVSAALVNREGNLMAFTRHPLAGPHTIQVSQKKAYTAATLQGPTGIQLQKERPDLNFAPGILLIQGGQPINVAGNFYGGIAVAGADTQIDEECAKTGLAVIQETLEFVN